MKHRNPNIPEEDFIEAFRDHWYDRGRQDGLSEALLAQVRQKEQREKGWW